MAATTGSPATTESPPLPGAFSATTVGGALGGAIVGLVVVLGLVIVVIGTVLLLKKRHQSKKGRQEGGSKEAFENGLYETGTYAKLM